MTVVVIWSGVYIQRRSNSYLFLVDSIILRRMTVICSCTDVSCEFYYVCSCEDDVFSLTHPLQNVRYTYFFLRELF